MIDSDMELSRACTLVNFLQIDKHFVAYTPSLTLHIAWEAERSRLPPGGRVGRPAGRYLHVVLDLLQK